MSPHRGRRGSHRFHNVQMPTWFGVDLLSIARFDSALVSFGRSRQVRRPDRMHASLQSPILLYKSQPPAHRETHSPELQRQASVSHTNATSHGTEAHRATDGGRRRRPGARPLGHHGGRAELRVRVGPVLQQVRVLRDGRGLLRRRVPVRPLRRAGDQQRVRGQHRHAGLLRRAPRAGRRLVRGQRVLHPRRLPRRRRLLPVVRPHRHRRRLQARDRRLLRQRQPRDHKVLLHQRDRRAEQELLRPKQHAVAVPGGEGVLRPRPAADLVELQLRARGAEHRLRRAGRPRRGGAQRPRRVPVGALVLDEQRARGLRLRAGLRRHHPGHQRRARVRRQEPGIRQQPRRLLQAVLPGLRRRPGQQPHLLTLMTDLIIGSLCHVLVC